jgi:hypothetical protein
MNRQVVSWWHNCRREFLRDNFELMPGTWALSVLQIHL